MTEKIFQKRNRLFKVGVIFITFWSLVIGFLNIGVLYLLGIPIIGLLLGIVFVWFSKETIKDKMISTFIPIPLILASFYLFYLLLPKAEPETFLIPRNFRGYIVVVFNENCGQSLVYESGRRIYDFSKNNIVITSANETLGVIDRKFYLVDENGNRTNIPEFHWRSYEEEQKDWHWSSSQIELSKYSVGVFWAYRNDRSFIISDYHSLERQDKETKEETEKIFQNELESALKECRQYSLK